MTILYHHRTFGDGAEGIHIHAMVDAFRAQGHRVLVTGLAAAGDGGRRGLPQRIRATAPGGLVELASIAASGFEYWQAVSEIGRVKPDFMYVRHSRHGLAALRAARRHGVPTVLEVNSVFSADRYHQFEPLTFRAAARRIERRAFESADVVVAVSSPLADEIRALAAVDPVVLPNGVDAGRFDPARADPDNVRARFALRNRLVVGWSGILRHWHGVDLLVEAVAGLPDSVILLVGDGPARIDVERRARVAGVADRLVVTGRVPHEAMPDYLAAMDMAVIADERTGVASPMKLIEYMAMALPVVAPRLPNIQDVVRDEVNGLLFSASDAGDLKRQLIRLAQNFAWRQQLGRQAREDVEREHTWRHNAERVLSLVRARGRQKHGTVHHDPMRGATS